MAINAAWGSLVTQVDTIVDATFGERVKFIPWSESSGYEQAGPDNSRQPSGVILACFEQPDASTSNTSAGFRIASELKLCVREPLLPDHIRKGDRVDFLDRDNWTLQVSYVEAGPTGRYTVHLLRGTESEIR